MYDYEKKELEELLILLEAELLRLGYKKKTMSFYRCRWNQLKAFAKENNELYYSEELGAKFIEQKFNLTDKDKKQLTKTELQNLRIVRMLGDFQLHGSILRRYNKHKKLLLNSDYAKIIEDFKQDCVDNNYSNSTIISYTTDSSKLLDYLQSKGITTINNITINSYNDYIKTLAGFTKGTIGRVLTSLRAFARYSFKMMLNKTDNSLNIPTIKVRQTLRIPKIWSVEDINKLISVIDRGNPVGKRDYAIILLACRLGLRTNDIKNLKLANFNWENKHIVIEQSKTGNMVNLPLLQDVGWAIIDYLKYGRPKFESPYLFFRLTPPYLPFSDGYHLDVMIKKYMKWAKIKISAQEKIGLHSLRHTLASLLLEKDTPLTTISNILGHVDSNSTSIYLKVDMKKLKECPIQIKEE
ncbi:MAG: site-specific integrase [Bacteroidales bacterium]|jgi:integrase/recombinase XerD|nr:site-specific integrase [Bacteroidales bacterium]